MPGKGYGKTGNLVTFDINKRPLIRPEGGMDQRKNEKTLAIKLNPLKQKKKQKRRGGGE